MSHMLFENLDEKEKGFFLAALIFNSAQYDKSFQILDESDKKKFLVHAEKVMSLKRSERVTILISELRSLLIAHSEMSLLLIDSSWFIEILKKENHRSRLLGIASLPKYFHRKVLDGLGMSYVELSSLPPIPCTLARIVRRAIQKQLAPVRVLPFKKELTKEIPRMLSKVELQTVICDLNHKMKENDSGLKILADLISSENPQLKREVAQRLPFCEGSRLLGMSEVKSLFPPEINTLELFGEALLKLAKERKIHEKFAGCYLP